MKISKTLPRQKVFRSPMLCPCGSADGTRLAVLVVEDEPMVALHLQSILKGNGYNVLGSFGTVGEALRLPGL